MPSDATFSIAIPVRGQAEYLADALASLSVQPVPVEVSIMDATPDDSVQRVIAGQGMKHAYMRHGPDSGQAAAIQEGWDRTGGEVLGWLCADDWLFPDALGHVAHAFREHPEVDVVYGDAILIDRQGAFVRHFPSTSLDMARIVRDCCISQPSCFVRRRAIDRVGGLQTGLHYIMDWDLWTRLFLAGCRFRHVPNLLSASRMHPGTKTTGNSSARMSEIWRHLRTHNGYLDALRSMAGFLMAPSAYPELGSGQPLTIGRAAHALLPVWRWLRPGTLAGRVIDGVEVATNHVNGRCVIRLPFYGCIAPTRLLVSAIGPVSLDAFHDGKQMPLVHMSDAGRHGAREYMFELPYPLPVGIGAYSLDSRSTHGRGWTLRRAGLR